MLQVSERWRAAYPGAAIGLLALRGVRNPARAELLERRKAELEAELRARYGGLDRARLKALPTLQVYGAYYRRFDKTYHVQLQLESVAFKHRPLPGGTALVQAMFLAELQSLLLTAGHDLDALRGEPAVEVASGEETYTLLNGNPQRLKAGDMFIRDREGVISSVLYGPDFRTRITDSTQRVLFTVYVPAGIQRAAVEEHLSRIKSHVLLFAPGAELEFSGII